MSYRYRIKIANSLDALESAPWQEFTGEITISCECHNSDAEHEIALSNAKWLQEIRGIDTSRVDQIRKEAQQLICEMFSLPTVAQAVYDVEAGQLADAIEQLIERGEL